MPEWSDEQITEYWTSGKTLPSEVLKQYPLPEQELGADKGYNVLIDMAHECNFTTLWTLPKQLNHIGYRSVGSHASINTVLDPKGESRIRMVYDTVNKVHPFVWMPNPEFQLIITGQNSADSQIYTEEELLALLEWVKAGGGLLVQGKSACRQITDIISTEQETSDENKMDIEKGRVWFSESTSDLRYPGRANQEQKDSVDLELKKSIGMAD